MVPVKLQLHGKYVSESGVVVEIVTVGLKLARDVYYGSNGREYREDGSEHRPFKLGQTLHITTDNLIKEYTGESGEATMNDQSSTSDGRRLPVLKGGGSYLTNDTFRLRSHPFVKTL